MGNLLHYSGKLISPLTLEQLLRIALDQVAGDGEYLYNVDSYAIVVYKIPGIGLLQNIVDCKNVCESKVISMSRVHVAMMPQISRLLPYLFVYTRKVWTSYSMPPSLPTLLIRGKLIANKPEDQERLNSYIPYEYIIEWFTQRLRREGIESRVLVLRSETASGKSTLIPAEIYKAFIRGKSPDDTRGIICTQPRILTAIENVGEILKNYNGILKLGETIGWSTQNNKVRLTKPGLTSATVGTLAQELKMFSDDEICQKYQFILIDETHERDIATDMTLYMLKEFLKRRANRPDCPFVVLMSATFDPEPLLRYYGSTREASFIYCKGEAAGFDTFWPDTSPADYISAAFVRICAILKENADDSPLAGDILVFMPGAKEIENLREKLESQHSKEITNGRKSFLLLELSGTQVRMKSRDYIALIAPLNIQKVEVGGTLYTPGRRIILSTNVAETGLTLDNLKYVIDTGFNKEIEYNSTLDVGGLITKPAPQSRITQRRGRAGRKFRGVFYPLYTQKIFNSLQQFQLPQILTGDISVNFLAIVTEQLRAKESAALQEFKLTDIDMVDIPSPDALGSASERLYAIGALRAGTEGALLTDMGTLIAQMQSQVIGLRPETARAILAAFSWQISARDIATMCILPPVSSLSSSSLVQPNWGRIYLDGLPASLNIETELNAVNVRNLICDEFIDCLILFTAAQRAVGTGKSIREHLVLLERWCESVEISYQSLISALQVREEMLGEIIKSGIDLISGRDLASVSLETFSSHIARIKYCLYDGYRANLCTAFGAGGKFRLARGADCDISPPLTLSRAFVKAGVTTTSHMFQAFVASELSFRLLPKTGLYIIFAPKVSVLDGYVNYDEEFLL